MAFTKKTLVVKKKAKPAMAIKKKTVAPAKPKKKPALRKFA